MTNEAHCSHEYTSSVQSIVDRLPQFHLCDDCHERVAACAECGAPLNERGGGGTGGPPEPHVHKVSFVLKQPTLQQVAGLMAKWKKPREEP
jgi:hypothetical protein